MGANLLDCKLLHLKSIYSLILITVICIIGSIPISCSKDVVKGPYNSENYYKEALKLIDNKDYKEAREYLNEIKNRDETIEYAPLAQIKIAETHSLNDEPELAIEEYREFLRIFPSHKYTVYAQFQIASTYYDQIEGHDREYSAAGFAIDEFNKLQLTYPRNPYSDIIKVRISQCKDILANHENYVGEYYYKKGSYDSAISRYLFIIKNYPDFSEIQKIYYNIGLTYLEKNEDSARASAKEYFKKAIELATDSKITNKAKKELQSLKN